MQAWASSNGPSVNDTTDLIPIELQLDSFERDMMLRIANIYGTHVQALKAQVNNEPVEAERLINESLAASQELLDEYPEIRSNARFTQLSRAVEQRDDKKPQLSDLRESGSIEQDADVVMFVYRESYYLENKEPKPATVEHAEWQAKMNEVSNLAELIIGKQRHGPTGNVFLEFEAMFTKFKDTQNN